jgi:hypothetical protein
LLSFKSVYMGEKRISHQSPHIGQGWDLFRSDWREGAVFEEKTSPGDLAAPGGLGTQEKVPTLSG